MLRNLYIFLSFTIAMALSTMPAAALGPRLVADVETGKLLAATDPHKRWYPASLTKMMTAYVAFRIIQSGQATLKSPIRVSKRALREPPSKMGYPAGTILPLDTALYIIMVKSANDISAAIGESLTGSYDSFIERMNEEAQRLGMTSTRFVNPHGLPAEGQYTTAHDMALLAIALKREFPQYAHFFSTEAVTIDGKVLRNYNILLGRFSGADGMKTGFICSSGFNLAASASRNGRSVVAVVFGAKSQEERAETAADLLVTGFATDPNSVSQTLGSARPSVNQAGTITDLRPVICNEQASANRWDGRDVEGRMVLHSPHIEAMLRQPKSVKIALGGANGPVPEAAREFMASADVPIPTPRPDIDNTAKVEPLSLNAKTELRPALSAAGVPTPRPELTP